MSAFSAEMGWEIVFNNPEYCEDIYWEDEKKCDNEGRCKFIYWEDSNNCIDWEWYQYDDNKLTQQQCELVIFPSTRKKCFERLKEQTK